MTAVRIEDLILAENVDGDEIIIVDPGLTFSIRDAATIATMVEPYECDRCGAWYDEADHEEHFGLCDSCRESS